MRKETRAASGRRDVTLDGVAESVDSRAGGHARRAGEGQLRVEQGDLRRARRMTVRSLDVGLGVAENRVALHLAARPRRRRNGDQGPVQRLMKDIDALRGVDRAPAAQRDKNLRAEPGDGLGAGSRVGGRRVFGDGVEDRHGQAGRFQIAQRPLDVAARLQAGIGDEQNALPVSRRQRPNLRKPTRSEAQGRTWEGVERRRHTGARWRERRL